MEIQRLPVTAANEQRIQLDPKATHKIEVYGFDWNGQEWPLISYQSDTMPDSLEIRITNK